MRPRRFLLATTFYPPYNFGGDGVFVRRLANALARRQHEVHVVHDRDAFALLAGGSAEPGPYKDFPGVIHHPIARRGAALPALLAGHQLGRPAAGTGLLRRLCDELAPEVIHFHNISLLGGPGVLEVGRAVKLCTLHDYWFVCPMHTLWRLGREPCGRRTCLRCTLHGRRPPQLWRYGSLVSRAAARVDQFLAPSRFAIDTHHRHGFPAPIRHLPHFVSEPDPATARDGESRRPFFLYAGRLERLKGVQSLLPAFARLPEADLRIAGSGSLEAELGAAAAGLANVELLGWVGSERLRELYRRAVAVVVPSACYETFGLVAIEAFAMGTPVIARRIGALTEMVEASRAGIAYDDEAELLRALRGLLESPEARRRLALRGRRSFREHYTEEVHLARYFELIAEVEERSGGGAG